MEKFTPILVDQKTLKKLDKFQKKEQLRTRNDAVGRLLKAIINHK